MAMPGWKPLKIMTALPTRKIEAFRYTDLRALAGTSFVAAPMSVPGDLPELGLPRVVFLNGTFDAACSSGFDYMQKFATVDHVVAMEAGVRGQKVRRLCGDASAQAD